MERRSLFVVFAVVAAACSSASDQSMPDTTVVTSTAAADTVATSEATTTTTTSAAAPEPTTTTLAPVTPGGAVSNFDPAGFNPNAGGRIPELNDPEMVPASTVTWLDRDDIVMGLVTPEGVAHAYPVDQMAYHHIANTTIGGEPYLVTY